MIRRLIYFMMLTVLTCACQQEPIEPLDMPSYAVYDIVTVQSTTEHGTVFSLQRGEDTPLIEYTCNYNFTSSDLMKPGRRIVICYRRIEGATYTSGRIDLFGYALLSNTDQDIAVVSTADADATHSDYVKIESVWRTGHYINMQACLYVYKALKPERFVLVADSATVDSPTPELHLLYRPKDDNDGHNLFSVRASFDLGDIWLRESTVAVKIIYNTPSGLQSVIFNK